MSTTTHERGGLGPIAAYVAISLIWGSTFLAIRIADETMPPWTMIGVRSLVAGGVLFGVALSRGGAIPNRRGWGRALISGGLMFSLCQSLLAWGETRLPSGQAAVLGCTVSLFIPLISWLMGASARPNIWAGFGLILGFGGVTVLAGGVTGVGNQVAAAAVFSTSIFWAVGSAAGKRWPPSDHPLMSSAMQLLCGGVLGLPFGGLIGEWSGLDFGAITLSSVLALLYLIVFGSLIAFACYGWLVTIWRPERVSTYAYINPIIALFLGAAWAGERVGPRDLAAVALILAAVAIVMLGNQRRSV